MAKFDREARFTVLNEYPHTVGFPVVVGDMIMLEPAHDGVPSMTIVRFDDILLAHTKSNIIRNGGVFFESEFEKEIYAELRIEGWEKIWHRNDIKNILLNPTAETLQEIVAIKDAALFDRIRGVYIGLVNAGFDIPQKTSAVIENRYHEWQDGIYTSKITIVKKDPEANDKQIQDLQEQVDQLKALINTAAPAVAPAPVLATVAETPAVVVPAAKDSDAVTQAKKRGRPPKAK